MMVGFQSRNVFVDVARQRQELTHAVAIVVVRDVFAPVHQRQTRLALRPLLVEVVRVDLLLAAVDLDDRRDQRDDVVTNLPGCRASRSTARRYGSSISISGPPVSVECMPLVIQ